jgi:hypothetical protein
MLGGPERQLLGQDGILVLPLALKLAMEQVLRLVSGLVSLVVVVLRSAGEIELFPDHAFMHRLTGSHLLIAVSVMTGVFLLFC